MKVAILVQYFPPKYLAGTELATYNSAKYLAKRGHEVHVLTWLDKDLPKESIEEGFYVHRISGQKIKFFFLIPFWIKIFWYLKKIKPDVVHVQNIALGIPALLSKKLLKKPYVVYGRGSEVYLPWIFGKKILKLILKNADEVIALTKDMKKEMNKIYVGNISIVPNGIEFEKFRNLPKRNVQKVGKNTVIFVGKLRSVKGLIYLINAIKNIKDKDKNIRLMLVGNGEDRTYLENLVKKYKLENCVMFIGKIPNEEVIKYMVDADVFVLPSLSEGFPNVILEAMASGLPIIATKVGGLPEIVEDEENGFLIEPKNSEEIAEKILLILEDYKLREKISNNNIEKAKKYSWEKVTESLEKIYLKL